MTTATLPDRPTVRGVPMARPRILIVEDERGLVQALSWYFDREGYETHVAQDGQEGLRKAQTLLPDLILLDVMLPGETGWDVAAALGEDARTRDIPVVFLTAMADESDLVRGREHGAVGYITKPFDPVGLGDTVEVTLERLARGEREQLRSEIPG